MYIKQGVYGILCKVAILGVSGKHAKTGIEIPNYGKITRYLLELYLKFLMTTD